MMNKIKNKYFNMPVQVRASLWFLICAFLQKGISTITTPIFTRLLTTTEYGQYNVFNSWLGIISIIVSLNLYFGVYNQGLVKFDKERKIFSSSLQGLTTVMVLFWTAIYLLFRDFWNNLFSLTTVQMLAMLIMIWASATFSFWAAEQRVEYKYRLLVIVTLIISAAKPTVGVFFVINAEDKVTARILGLLLVEVIGYTAFYIIQMGQGKTFFSAKFWKYALKFNIPLVPHYLSQVVLNNSDRIMISNLVSADKAGIYSLAYSASLVMTLFNSSLMQTISPWMYTKIKLNKIKDIASIAYITLIIIAGVNLLLIVLAPEVIAIFAPASYYEAIWIIPPVAISAYFMYSYDLFAKFTFYYEKTNFIMFASVIGAGLNIILNYIFINLFGYIAAGYTTLFCYIVYAVAHYIMMTKICDKFCNGVRPYDIRKILIISGIFVVIGLSFLFTYNYMWIRYSIVGIALIVTIIKRKDIIAIGKRLLSLKKSIQ